MSRTQNSFYNLITGLATNFLIIVLNFVTRSVFVRCLGTSYLGIEGLFTNVLSVLSLAELGFGSAIAFKLYKPIEEGDEQRIRVLMKLYRQTYLAVGAVILAAGLCLIPVLPMLVRDYERFGELGLNAVAIFLIYLANSACSYWFFAYKAELVTAYQKSYIINIIDNVLSVASSISQILILVFTRNFILYVAVRIVFTILLNVICAAVCDRRYPFVRERTSESVTRRELKDFFRDCASLFLYRANDVVISASDNIVLSKLLGLTYVGLYSNYLAVKVSLKNVLSYFTYSLQASLGSIYTTGKLEWSRLLFRVVNFATAWLFGVVAIGTALLLDDFISLWLGSDYVVATWTYGNTILRTPVALLVGIELYFIGQQYDCGAFRSAAGLFQKAKLRPVASILVNLIVSIVTVPYLGIAGVIVGTILSGVTTTLIVDPIVIHKYALRQPAGPFFLRSLLYIALLTAAGLLSRWVCGRILLGGIAGFIVHGLVCVLVPSAVFTVCFFKTQEFRFLRNTVADILRLRLGQKPNE